MTIGSAETRLIVLRGNSGAGKSTVAAELRAANIGLIDQITRYAELLAR